MMTNEKHHNVTSHKKKTPNEMVRCCQ